MDVSAQFSSRTPLLHPLGLTVGLLLALLLLPLASQAGTPMHPPFLEDFSSNGQAALDTNGAWSTQLAGAGSSVMVELEPGSSNPVCRSLDASVTLNVEAAGNHTNTWTRMRIFPVPVDAGAEPALPSTSESFAFFVNTAGAIQAVDGNAWVTVGNAPLNQWLVFAIHSDYQNRTWDLYFAPSAATGNRLTKMNSNPLAFRTGSSPTQLQAVSLVGDSTVDDIAIATDGQPVNATASKDKVMVQAKEMQAGVQYALGLMPYGYPVGQNNLASALGEDLYRCLQDNDVVVLHDTSMHAYIRDSGLPQGWDDTGKNGLDMADAHLRPGSGLFLTKATTGPYIFFTDYDAIPPTQNRPLLGRQHGAFGLNLLAWDRDTMSMEAGVNGLGFVGQAGAGDKLYIPDPARGPYATKLLYWDAVNNRWMDANKASVDRLAPGVAFWYVRRATSDTNWMIGAAE